MRYSSKLHNVTRLVSVSVAALALGLIALPANAQSSGNSGIVAPEAKAAPVAKPKTAYKPYFFEFRVARRRELRPYVRLVGQVNGRNEIVKSDIAGLHPAGDRNDCENCSVYTMDDRAPYPGASRNGR